MCRISSPCRGCTERSIEPNCHNSEICEKWAIYEAKMNEDRAKLAKYHKSYEDYANYISEAHLKIAKRKKSRGR